MSKHYNTLGSRFFCTKCGKEGIPIQRKKGQERESGHLKKLYCIYCGEEVNHVEIKEDNPAYTLEDFKEEFELGRFEEGQRSAMGDLSLCSKLDCPYNKDGKCWNSNYSTDCPYRPSREVIDNG